MRSRVGPEGVAPEALAAALADALKARVGAPREVTRVWLDTFDGRLHRARRVLALVVGDGASALHLARRGGRPEAVLPVSGLPRRPADLPPGRARDRVAAAVGIRALLPVVQEEVRVVPLVGADGADLGVDVEEVVVPEAPEGRRRVGVRVRGAGDPQVLDGLGLAEAPGTALDEALAAVGRPLAGPRGRPEVALDPSERADDALRAVLRALLRGIEAQEEGVIADLDPEFLHDLRVGVRRTRSLLREVRRVLPADVARRFGPGFRELQRRTGPLRDLDVLLLALPEHAAALDPSFHGDLAPLRRWLEGRREAARAEGVRALGGRRWRRLREDWRAWLDAPGPLPTRRAGLPVERAAREDARRLWRRALAEGRAIAPDSPAEQLHALRKTCKELRYVLQAFQGVLPPAPTRGALRELARLQDLLGAFQDREVHADALAQAARDALAAGACDADALLATGALVAALRAAQAEARAAFPDAFAAFDRRKVRRGFKAIVDG